MTLRSLRVERRALGVAGAGLLFLLVAAGAAETAPGSLGVFTSQTDVGAPTLNGSGVYDPKTQTHTLSGAGKNMWFGEDEFHFVWKRMKGDFILRTRAAFIGQGADPHRKLGWMVRSTLETGSPHVNAVVHGDGLTSLQFRRAAGGDTEEIRSELVNPRWSLISTGGRGRLMCPPGRRIVARWPSLVTRDSERHLRWPDAQAILQSHQTPVARARVPELLNDLRQALDAVPR